MRVSAVRRQERDVTLAFDYNGKSTHGGRCY